MFIPNKIVKGGIDKVFKVAAIETIRAASDLIDSGFCFYVVDQIRGRCYFDHRVITIPSFVFRKPDTAKYISWYLAHECAHGFNFISLREYQDNHGPMFMEELKRICPADCLHFETNYKPRNAMAAGISNIPFFNTGVIPDDF